MKYSIITIAMNRIDLTSACIESVYKHTKDFELIVIDNNSSDGTTGYLNSLPHDNVKVIRSDKNLSFSESNNLGLNVAEGEYIIFLNNDTVVTPDWADRLRSHFENVPLKNIGAVGPVSNMSNGKQQVGSRDSEAWYKEHYGKWSHTGCLFGWCLMVKNSVLKEVGGFDERFTNSHEDNDLSLRIQLAGYQLVIAYDTYINHVGQGTIRASMKIEDYVKSGYVNREKYYDKYYNPERKKLVAVYRTNGGKYLEASLEQTSKFVDSIIINFVRSKRFSKSTDEGLKNLAEITKRFPKIVKVGHYDGIFQEDYERNWLLQEALKLHERGDADWCISVDDDEIYEDKFVDRVQSYMNPRNPEIMAYWCNWRTIWDRRCGKEYFRTNSTFGRFKNYRFFKLIKGQEIWSTHPEGHHCGSAPYFADPNIQWLPIRVKHLGYDTPEQRQRKYEFYQKNDNFKNPADIGNEDYGHLIDLNPTLQEWTPDNGISFLMMVKNEEDHILECLERVQYLVDEYVIVDTGSTDGTMDKIRQFKEHSPVPVTLVNKEWEDNYSIPRNFGKALCKEKWILMMDADERFKPQDMHRLFEYTEDPACDCVVFHVLNFLEAPQPGKNQRYASSQSARLYKNIPDLYYSGIIHETIDDSVIALKRKRKAKGITADIPLYHYGYLKEKKQVKSKMDYYEEMNLKQIEVTEGLDPRPFYNLATHYFKKDDPSKSVEYMQKALAIKQDFYHALHMMASVNMRSAKDYLARSLQATPQTHPALPMMKKMHDWIEENDYGMTEVT